MSLDYKKYSRTTLETVKTMFSSVLTSWLYSIKPLFLFRWHFMELTEFSLFVLDYLSASCIDLDFSSEHHRCLLVFMFKEYVSVEAVSLGYSVTLNVIPVGLQWAPVMDIVTNDIRFIRICQNRLGKLWPLERAQYCIVLGKHTFKEFLSWHSLQPATSFPFSVFHYIYRLSVITRVKWEV